MPQLSIVLPASVLGVTDDLRVKTFRAGLIGRAAAIFRVNEVVIYLDDHREETLANQRIFSKLLKYMTVPQYLRRIVFRKDRDLRFAGLLPPLKTPSHTVPSSLKRVAPGSFRLACIVGERNGMLVLEAGLEKRLNAPVPEHPFKARIGENVLLRVEDPSRLLARVARFEESPFYLGYRVSAPRMTLGELLKGLDAVKIGTSRYGVLAWERLSQLRGLLSSDSRVIVAFGSPSEGLREMLAREKVKIEDVFDLVLNMVGEQGTETIRTEEAVFITLPLIHALSREG
ncbi:MAG: putative RNA uridine N3 methyltransferase [Thermoproteota archaeon]